MKPKKKNLPLKTQELLLAHNLDVPYDPQRPEETAGTKVTYTGDLEKANVITSMVKNSDKHKVVLDVDLPVTVVPSTTEGHYHLFIDKEISLYAYEKILDAFAFAGIIEQGYKDASKMRGFTAVRLPWVKKPLPKRGVDKQD